MIAAIIYSRLNSNRLANKALLNLGQGTLISTVIERAKKLQVDKIIVATSNSLSDDYLESYLLNKNIVVFRGDLNDVAKRTIDCINYFNIDTFIRINGDSPLIPTTEINSIISNNKQIEYDIITNIFPRSFPYGYSIEIINSNIFREYYQFFNTEHKEHITKYFYENSERFKIYNASNHTNLSDNVFLTIDDEISYSLMEKLFSKYPKVLDFELDEIINAYKTIEGKNLYD